MVLLHADTRFPPDGARALRDHLSDPRVTGGNFRVVFDGGDAFARWLTGFYAWFRGTASTTAIRSSSSGGQPMKPWAEFGRSP